MNLTEKLKAWLVKHCGVEEDAGEDEFRKAAGEAFANCELTAPIYTKLTTEDDGEVNEFATKLDRIADGLAALTQTLTQKEEKKPETKEEKKVETKEVKQPSRMAKMIGSLGGTPVEVDGKDIDIRVKEAAEMYTADRKTLTYPTHTKSGRPHPMAGRPVMDFSDNGRAVNESSERDMAVCGAFAKFLCSQARMKGSRTFAFQQLPQHDKELLCHALENMEWSGASDGGDRSDIVRRRLTPTEQKAVIDDAVSGGLEAAPIVFDDQVIQTPLLNGELYPLVNTVPLDRGRRVEGVSTGTVTGSWGGVDDTAIALFNTASYVSAFDTTIFRWEGSVRIGLDFLSDTPIDFGAHFTQQYGERLLEDLDDVIAVGNGTTQPEGVMNKVGATSVAFGGVAATIGGYESLRFGVSKQEHKASAAASAVFCGTETSYIRAMAIPVGAADARRLAQTQNLPNYDGYSWMGRAYKINGSMANTQIFYAILARYRMYRRRGLTIRTSTEGDTLIRNNELLLVATARFGGQMERGACVALTTTAQA